MNSTVLPIAHYCPSAGKCGKADEDVELRKEFGKGASFNVNETQSLDDVTHRIEHGEPLRPYGHGTYGSEKSWHEDEDDEEEEHGERCLSSAVAIVADDKGEGWYQYAEDQQEEEHHWNAAFW